MCCRRWLAFLLPSFVSLLASPQLLSTQLMQRTLDYLDQVGGLVPSARPHVFQFRSPACSFRRYSVLRPTPPYSRGPDAPPTRGRGLLRVGTAALRFCPKVLSAPGVRPLPSAQYRQAAYRSCFSTERPAPSSQHSPR